MTRRERLIATLRGEPVDRPAVNFYEIGGFKVDPKDPDPFNIYNSPSWQPLLELAEECTDIIRMRSPATVPSSDNCASEFFTTETFMENGSKFTRTTLKIAGRTMTSMSRQDPDVATVWNIEPLLKDLDDLEAYLQIPDEAFKYEVSTAELEAEDEALGDKGIVMVDMADPLCLAASLFSMEDFTIVALTEPTLFRKLLDKQAARIYPIVEKTAEGFSGRLWRIVGPEYASEPYLPPKLFREYVFEYDKPIVEAIQKHGGFARIHCHGRIKNVLPIIADLNADGIDPIEPPPQGDVELAYVRREYGKQFVLFGNLEISDVENMPPDKFEAVAAKSISDGTQGEGRGFVLMPSASPYGRTITPTTMANYQTMIRLAANFGK